MVSLIDLAARDSAKAFRIIDISLGVTSSLPILFYTFFIFLFARAELIINLPSRLQTATKYFILLVIPIIIALHEIASFIGLSYSEPIPPPLEHTLNPNLTTHTKVSSPPTASLSPSSASAQTQAGEIKSYGPSSPALPSPSSPSTKPPYFPFPFFASCEPS